MSLHKELVQAFGGSRPLRRSDANPGGAVLLGDRQESADEAARTGSGFTWRRIDFALVINAAGDIVDVERPPWRLYGKRRKSWMQVPPRQFGAQQGSSGFLWGGSLNTLGLRRGGARADVGIDTDSFLRFRTFHRTALGDTHDPSLRAFLAFLRNWPEWTVDIPDLRPVIGGSLVFRFQYDEHFLHETHAARLIWSRLRGANTGCWEPPEAA